jgi:hypothetical protein
MQALASGELKVPRRVAADGLQNVMNVMLDLLQPPEDLPRNYYVGDIEGREDNQLSTMLNNGLIKIGDDGRAHFTDDKTRVVFLGDIGDRGPWSIRARKILTDLKTEDPTRVDIVWGNRCLSKLGLLNDLPKLKSLKPKGYQAWLAKKSDLPPGASREELQAKNTPAMQVQFWLAEHSAREALMHSGEELNQLAADGGLEMHRKALAEKRGVPVKSVTLDEAAGSRGTLPGASAAGPLPPRLRGMTWKLSRGVAAEAPRPRRGDLARDGRWSSGP